MLLPFTTSTTLGFRKSKPCFQTRPAAQVGCSRNSKQSLLNQITILSISNCSKIPKLQQIFQMKSEVKGLTSLPFWNQEYGNISSNLGVKISSNSATSLASILGNQNLFRRSFYLAEPQPNPRHRISTTVFLLRLWDINIANHPLPHSGQQASQLGLATEATEPWSKTFSPIGVQDKGWRWATICVWGNLL